MRIEGHLTREGMVGEFVKVVGLVLQDFKAQHFSTDVTLEVTFAPENFRVGKEEMARRVLGAGVHNRAA